MKKESTISRRRFLQLGASFGMLAGLRGLNIAHAAGDYKALVCCFLLGGNDGHNMIVPLAPAQYGAYTQARPALALGQNQLLGGVNDAVQGPFGFHYSMPEMRAQYIGGRLAVLANVGMLVQPTSFANQNNAGFPLPLNLRSHSDQITQMQTGVSQLERKQRMGRTHHRPDAVII